jgi:hypothetical protein
MGRPGDYVRANGIGTENRHAGYDAAMSVIGLNQRRV